MRGNTIRRALRGDLATLVALERHFPGDRLSRASFRHLIARGHADVLVCECAGTVCASAVVLYRKRSRRARFYSLVTAPAFRGRGIGTRLLAAAERAARQRGCTAVVLEVRPDNAGALHLYQNLGYERVTTLRGFYEDGADAIRLGKTLSGSPRRALARARAAGRPTA